MKIIGMFLVMAGCVGLGLWYRMTYQKRLHNLKNWEKAILLIRGEIAYGRTPLFYAMEQVIGRVEGTTKEFFQWVSSQMEEGKQSLDEIWLEVIHEIMTKGEVQETDKREIQELGKTLGVLDTERQIQSLDLHLERIRQSIQEKELEKKNKTKLYPVLGTMCGIMVCIIFS